MSMSGVPISCSQPLMETGEAAERARAFPLVLPRLVPPVCPHQLCSVPLCFALGSVTYPVSSRWTAQAPRPPQPVAGIQPHPFPPSTPPPCAPAVKQAHPGTARPQDWPPPPLGTPSLVSGLPHPVTLNLACNFRWPFLLCSIILVWGDAATLGRSQYRCLFWSIPLLSSGCH